MKKTFKGIIGIIVLVLVLFFAMQWWGYHQMKDLYDEAMLYFNEQDYEKSCALFEEASEKNSIFGNAMKKEIQAYEAEGYYYLGEYKKAIALYNTLLDSGTDEEICYLMKGACYIKAGKTDKAEDIFKEGWDETGDLEFVRQLCSLSMDSGDMESAQSYIEIGLEQEGEDQQEFLFDEIILYEKQEEYEKAYEAAQKYCEAYPDDEKGQKELTFLSTRI